MLTDRRTHGWVALIYKPVLLK